MEPTTATILDRLLSIALLGFGFWMGRRSTRP